jgi:hypothetical protein
MTAGDEDDAGTSKAQSPTCSVNVDSADDPPPWEPTLAPGSGGKADGSERGAGPLAGEIGLEELRNGFADDATRAGEENPAPAASRRCGSPEPLASPSASRELQATVIFRTVFLPVSSVFFFHLY